MDKANATREQAAIVEAIFSQARTGCALLDHDCRFVRVNAALARRLGLRAPDLPGLSASEVIRDDDLLEGLKAAARTLRPVAVSSRAEDRGPTEGRRSIDWNWSVTPILDDAGKLEFLFLTGEDASDLTRAEEKLKARETVYQSVFNAMSEGVIFQAADGSIVAANPAAERILGSSAAEIHGRDSDDRRWGSIREDGSPFPGDQHPAMVTLRTGQPQTNVVMGILRPDGQRTWISINSQPLIYPGEALPHSVVTTFHDITERKAADERLLLLAREVDHRANNLLASVQSVVSLTRAEDISQFQQTVLGRIGALAHAHRLLAESRWAGARLSRVVDEELQAFRAPGRVTVEGPDASLAPPVAQGLAMALHELATNAVKHGALATPEGRLTVAWGPPDQDGLVQMSWLERSPHPVQAPTRSGFGTALLRRALSSTKGGSVELDWQAEGLACRLRFPVL